MVYADAMYSERSLAELGLFVAVAQDAIYHAKTRWRQEPLALGAPLAVRLAVFQGDVLGELDRAFLGAALVPPEVLALLILRGVVEAGEDKEAVEAASGVKLN